MQFTTIFIFISLASAAPFYVYPFQNTTIPSLNTTTPFNNTANTTITNTTTTTTTNKPFTILTITNPPSTTTVTPSSLPHTSHTHGGEKGATLTEAVVIASIIVLLFLSLGGWALYHSLKSRRQNRESS
ncbi:hypothetical protein V8F20_006386 [Naviculisporaceae sp. PSN 640]